MHDRFLLLFTKFKGLAADEEGQDLVEYALMLTLITLALITSISSIATAVVGMFSTVSASLA